MDSAAFQLRRSERAVNAINLGGAAGNPTFVQRMTKLFFRQQTTESEIQAILSSKRRKGVAAMSVTRATTAPHAPIYILDNFLTESELQYFDGKIQSSLAFQQSFVDDTTSNEKRSLVDDEQRTSTFYSFGKLQDTKVAALEQRVAALLGCMVHQIEPLQLVRYEPGEFFSVHHDMGELKDDDTVELPKKDLMVKRRLVTIFCYLNTLEEGYGRATYFPRCGDLRVRPVRGRAVLWSNVTQEGQPDDRTIHAGEAVTCSRKYAIVGRTKKRLKQDEGIVKYGLNIWICEE